MRNTDWVRPGVRAVLSGVTSLLLASVVNPVLFVLAVVTLLLSPVPGLGMALFAPVITLVRARADLERRRAGRWGVAIARPYAPRPPGLAVGWKRYRWILTDPATWRDLAWLIPGAAVGAVLGLVSLVVPLYGVQGVLLLPFWLYLGGAWYGYGLFWPTGNAFEGLLALPQGVLLIGAGLVAAPWLRKADHLFARLLLAPTRAAELRLRVAHLTVTRADTVDAQAAELRRIERDLHDGAQARLVSLGMTIGLAEELLDHDPATARRLLAEARESSGTALTELRDLVRGIHPPVLAERGLAGAIRALALKLPLDVTVDADEPAGRPETPVESAAYFAVAEILANTVKHSAARTASITLRHTGARLVLTVRDDGRGGADPAGGSGLRGIERRLAAFDGTMALSSPPGGPTVVTMELPCVLSSPKILRSSGTA